MYFFSNERPTRQSLFTVTCIYTNYKHHKRIVIRFGGEGRRKEKRNDIYVMTCDRARSAVSYMCRMKDAQSRRTSSAIVTVGVALLSARRDSSSNWILSRDGWKERRKKTAGVSLAPHEEIRPLSFFLSLRETIFYSEGNRYKSLSLQLCINRSLWLAYQLYNRVSLVFFLSLSP